LKIKHLLDVSKPLKIKGLMCVVGFVITHFLELVKKPKSHRKATEKDTEKHQTVENQALAEIFFGFSVYSKNPLTRPTPTPWHDFCMPPARFFYTFLYHRKNRKTKNKKQRKTLRE